MISAVTAQGKLRFSRYTGKVHRRPVHRVLPQAHDRHRQPGLFGRRRPPSHRSRAVKEFVASTEGRLKLFVLPGYSPELNPDEWVWKNVKHDRVGRTSVTGPDDFKTKVISALRRLQKLPHIVRAFFVDPDLRYITA